MGRLISLAAVSLGQAGLASAAPTCTRIASQWAVVFPAECTVWFQQVGTRQGLSPASCTQVRLWFVTAYEFFVPNLSCSRTNLKWAHERHMIL